MENGMYEALLIEDDREIRKIICDYFHYENPQRFVVSSAKDGYEGIRMGKEKDYDIIFLDIMLPGVDGFEVLRSLREGSIVPVIFLTARGREEDRLYGYSLGCDDYMIKPFSIKELSAKAKAILKRVGKESMNPVLQIGDISLNPATFQVTAAGCEVKLSPKQFALLKYLMENQGIVLSRDAILDRVWGYYYEGSDRVVDNHIKRLRKTLGFAGKQIKTVVTKGYTIV